MPAAIPNGGVGSTTSTDRGNIYGSGTQGQSGGLKLLGEELAEPSHRGHSVYRPSPRRPRRWAATASAPNCRSRPPEWRRAHFSPATSPASLPLSGQTPKTLARAEPQRPSSSSQFQATVQTSVPQSLLGHHPVGVKPPVHSGNHEEPTLTAQPSFGQTPADLPVQSKLSLIFATTDKIEV